MRRAAGLDCGAVAVGLGVATGGDVPVPQPPAPQTPAPPPLVPAKVTLTAVVGKTFAVAPVVTDASWHASEAAASRRCSESIQASKAGAA